MGLTTDHLSMCCLIQYTEDLSRMGAELAGVIANSGPMHWISHMVNNHINSLHLIKNTGSCGATKAKRKKLERAMTRKKNEAAVSDGYDSLLLRVIKFHFWKKKIQPKFLADI